MKRIEEKEMAFNKKKNAAPETEEPEVMQEEAPEEECQEAEEASQEAAPQEAAPQEAGLLEKAQAQAEEYLSMAQRVQADFENYRRRTKATRAEAFEDGAREVIKQLLPVVDNLERAIAQETADEALATGVRMVYRQLMDTLEKRGVSVIDRAGEKFDPNLENAVMQGTSEEGEPGTVCAVLQKGYRLGDTVIRHAMVKVVAE